MKNSNSIIRILFSVTLMFLVAVTWSFAVNGSDSLVYPIVGILFLIGMVKPFLGIQFRLPTGYAFIDGFVINDTTYAGEAASQFIVNAITGADTIAGGHCYIKDGIKKEFTIPRWSANYEDFIQDRAATPTSQGSMVVDGKLLFPQNFMIYTEFNPRDFEDHWFATQLNPTLINRTLPVSVESVVIQEVLKRYVKYFNKAIWNNDKTLLTIYKYFDGWIKNAANDATSIKVVATTLTASNIQAEFLKIYQAIPAALRYDPSMKIFVSYATYDLYAQSQINQTYKGVDTTQEGIPLFKGRRIVKIADFPDNTALAAKGMATMESNLWIGMNSIADEGLELKQLQANSELWFIKMLMKADVQIGWGNEVVLYQ
jgi:hypothetical protein